MKNDFKFQKILLLYSAKLLTHKNNIESQIKNRVYTSTKLRYNPSME